MSTVTLHLGNNLDTLAELKAAGAKFDLVELDGPYMAGLEDWDSLSEAEYIQHYADRLALVRDVLQPWGVVFVFGYPEGCAEIKSWAHRSGTLYLRRWLSWYNNQAAHAGRKIQTVIVLMKQHARQTTFHTMLRERRNQLGLTYKALGAACGYPNGRLALGVYERFDGQYLPNVEHYLALQCVLGFELDEWWGNVDFSFDGLTDLDYITVPIERATTLNDAGLRSKPVQLYLDLFRPTIPPTGTRRALVLYGGSGNAGIAAAALGYDVTICEADPARVALIRDRWAGQVAKWTQKAQATQAALPLAQAAQGALFGANP